MNKSAATTEFIPFSRSELEQSISARFEQQVWRYPDKLAIKTRLQSVSYSDLYRSANRLAAAVHGLLADSEAPVAVFFEQGIPLVTAILAVLKAGRIYVPLDPADSRERIDSMLRDSGAALILTDEKNYQLASAWESTGCKVANTGRMEGRGYVKGAISVDPDSPAYIYYTSGSTGRPKGVYDSHRNVLHNVMRYTNKLRISANDGLLLLQSSTFSGSVSNIFCSLLNGATLFPLDFRKAGIDGLADLLIQEPISIYHSVPAVFRQLMACTQSFPGLRVVRLEGDQSSVQHVQLFQKYFGRHCILVNGLGATETGIVRMFTIHVDTVLNGAVVPVGYATEDMETLLVDETGAEVPAGETGEIMIRSRYLACGYWKNPRRTQTQFRPCPVDPAHRIYCTGDLGRLRPDGCLEHLGRRDFQLKVMGRWVAIPEIERALMQLEGINEAVVSLHRDAEDSRLVAYLVPALPGAPPTVSFVGQALAKCLPDHVLPSRYVMLDTLPLDASGKLDRKSLPSPSNIRPELDQPYVAPGNTVEQGIAAIWCEVLGVSSVGVNDNFLQLGGDSLQAMGIVNRINAQFLAALSFHTILEYSTVAELARAVTDSKSDNSCGRSSGL
jgi:amino acid adenylation domain-containing protein